MGQLINGVLDLYCGILALVILCLRLRTKYRASASRRNRVMLAVNCAILISDGLALCFFHENAAVYTVLHILSITGFYLIAALYMDYICSALAVSPSKSVRALFFVNAAVCGAGAVYWGINCIRPFFFDLYHRTTIDHTLYMLGMIPGGLSVVFGLFLIVKNRKKVSFGDGVFLIILPLLPLVSSLIGQLLPGLSLQYSLIFASLLLNHFRFDAKLDRELENKTRDLEIQKREVETLRLRNRLERVKPHFIYNVLTTIYYLCEKDPSLAQKTVGLFSDFLRSSLVHVEQAQNIPAAEELRLVQNYVKLEELRFGNKIAVTYEIGPATFLVPPFCVQPLVENAIKHGLRKKTDGRIVISTVEEENDCLIIVKDNGEGFDAGAPIPEDKPSGIRNIRELLALTGSGRLEIISSPEGTQATLRFPKHTAENENNAQ